VDPVQNMLVISRTRTVLGSTDVAVSSTVVWNSLLADMRVLSLTVSTFAKHLKNYIFWDLDQRISASEDFLVGTLQMD